MKPWVHRAFGLIILCIWLLVAVSMDLPEALALILRVVEMVAIAVIAIFLGLLLHEFGHILAGLVTGMRFLEMKVAGITFAKKQKGFSLTGKLFESLGGHAAVRPRTTAHLRERLIFVSVSGLIASVAGVALAIMLVLVAQEPENRNTLLLEFGAFFGVACGRDLLISLKLNPKGYETDAQRSLAMIRQSRQGKEIVASHVIHLALESKQTKKSEPISSSRPGSTANLPTNARSWKSWKRACRRIGRKSRSL